MDEEKRELTVRAAKELVSWLESEKGRKEIQNSINENNELAKQLNQAIDINDGVMLRAFTS